MTPPAPTLETTCHRRIDQFSLLHHALQRACYDVVGAARPRHRDDLDRALGFPVGRRAPCRR
jgi:hypothetical protein